MRITRYLLAAAALCLAAPSFADAPSRSGAWSTPGRMLLAQKRKKRRRKKPVVPEAQAKPASGTKAVTEQLEAGPAGGDPDAEVAGEEVAAGNTLRRSNRMEFDARVIKGQTATSGAVYLFNRAPRQLPALLKLEQSYLRLIVDPVLGPQEEEEVK